MVEKSGFKELEHTADWALHVWAPDLVQLLITAAKGMYSLSDILTDDSEMQNIVLNLPYLDQESLLVDFLSELIFLGEVNNLAAVQYNMSLAEQEITANITAANIINRNKEITAVTFHNLKISSTRQGLDAIIVFDV